MRARGLALALLVALGPLGCADYSEDIDSVKRAETIPGTSNEQLVNQLAGARGKVEWSAGPSPSYPDNDDIVAVTGTVERSTRTGQKRYIVLEFINNQQTGQVALERMLVDGRPQTLLTSALNLMLMELE